MEPLAPILRRVDVTELQAFFLVRPPKPQKEIFHRPFPVLICRLVTVGQGDIQIISAKIREDEPKELFLPPLPIRFLDGWRRLPRRRDSVSLSAEPVAEIFFHFPVVWGGKNFFTIWHFRPRVSKIKLLSQGEKRAKTPFFSSFPRLVETRRGMCNFQNARSAYRFALFWRKASSGRFSVARSAG